MAQFCSQIHQNFWQGGMPHLELTPLLCQQPAWALCPRWPCHSFQDFFQRTTGISVYFCYRFPRRFTFDDMYVLVLCLMRCDSDGYVCCLGRCIATFRWKYRNYKFMLEQCSIASRIPLALILMRFRQTVVKEGHGQGMARHTRQQVAHISKCDMKVLSTFLGN